MIRFYCYSKCSTCKKAKDFLDLHHIPYDYIDIKTAKFNPILMKEWHEKSKKDIKKLFNTSGNLYKELKIKDKMMDMQESEIYDLLSSDGMMIKRPILVMDDKVLFGYKEDDYKELLK